MSQVVINPYAISSITFEGFRELGYRVEDLRDNGIPKVIIKQRKGRRYVAVGQIFYDKDRIHPSNEFLVSLIIKSHSLVPKS